MAAPAATSIRIGDLLIREGLITKEQLDQALLEQKQNGTRVGYNLVKLGFIPELELTKTLAKQYKKLFELENVGLTFDPEALRAVSQRALKRGTGARGLRAILETMMTDIMYELPSIPNLKEVVINEGVVLKNDKPELSYTSPEEQAARDVKKAETA